MWFGRDLEKLAVLIQRVINLVHTDWHQAESLVLPHCVESVRKCEERKEGRLVCASED